MQKIAIIYGGKSAEREVSINTADSIASELEAMKYNFEKIEIDQNLTEKLKQNNIDLVINSSHGAFGEDGRVSAMLDILEIPYSHAGSSAANIGMNKFLSKLIAEKIGIKVPKFELVRNKQELLNSNLIEKPFVLKPVSQGSSVGVEIVLEAEKFKYSDKLFSYGDLLIEEYVEATEVHVAIIDNKAVGTVEIKPKSLFYDYKAKYQSGDTEYVIPPKIDKNIEGKIMKLAEKFHNFIECNYISRVDFLLKGEEMYFLEINTHPGFTKTSLVPKIAQYYGISFAEIIKGLIKSAKFADNV